MSSHKHAMVLKEFPFKQTFSLVPLIQICKKEKRKFVDGKMFWNWQAEKQLEEFIKEIIKGKYEKIYK